MRIVQAAGPAEGPKPSAETLWLRAVAQLADPDLPAEGELKTRRDEALRRYLDGGAAEDWDELQRLGEAIAPGRAKRCERRVTKPKTERLAKKARQGQSRAQKAGQGGEGRGEEAR